MSDKEVTAATLPKKKWPRSMLKEGTSRFRHKRRARAARGGISIKEWPVFGMSS
jgi:hypothetical protein